jgi:hypothetical protein
MTLTSEQRTKIQQTVLAGNNVPRINNVNFALNVGVSVPRSVRVVDVPPTLIEIYPQWRGHQYFVVHDDIVIGLAFDNAWEAVQASGTVFDTKAKAQCAGDTRRTYHCRC